MRIIEVADYDSGWPLEFESEAGLLESIFPLGNVELHHIGSTSVPGMPAKPTIDILLITDDLKVVDSAAQRLEDIGYRPMGEYGITGRRFFIKVQQISEDDWINRVHLHAFLRSDRLNTERHLAVRDFLMSHPDRAEEYGNLKKSLACECQNNPEIYVSGKEPYMKKLEKDALNWYRNRK